MTAAREVARSAAPITTMTLPANAAKTAAAWYWTTRRSRPGSPSGTRQVQVWLSRKLVRIETSMAMRRRADRAFVSTMLRKKDQGPAGRI
jgi:hypothetical protein